jgi:hypothetical protein
MIRLIQKPLGQLVAKSSLQTPTRLHLKSQAALGAPKSISREVSQHVSSRSYHISLTEFQPADGVHVAVEKSLSESITKSQSASTDNKSCGDPVEDDEMEQEEMFVTADPMLGHGKIQEWGGPRRGGSLMEPTRFGDWERKGRCTDF